MTINPLAAAAAYQNRMKLTDDASSGDANASGSAGGSSFMQMVENGLKSVSDAQNKSEALQLQSLSTGKVELTDLVTAVSNAELSLNTVVAIRDRVINAYNDIIKMAI